MPSLTSAASPISGDERYRETEFTPGALRHLDLVCLSVVWLLLMAVANPLGDFSLNDDWVYGLAVKTILRTGVFALPSPATANVVLQAYWGALFCLPFGFSFTALRFSTLVLGLIGLNATYMIVREAGGDRRAAFISAAALGVNPIYFVLSASFMTDVPFTALCAVALWLFIRGMRTDRGVWIVSAFVVALAAVMIRQFGLLFVLAFGVAYVLRKGANLRSFAVAAIPLLMGLVAQVALQKWLISTGRTPVIVAGSVKDLLPNSGSAVVKSVVVMIKLIPCAGMMLAPVIVMVGYGEPSPLSGRDRTLKRAALLALAALLTVFFIVVHSRMPVPGNILTSYGIGPLTLRDTYLLGANAPHVPLAVTSFWVVVTFISAFAGAAAALVLLRAVVSLAIAATIPSGRREIWLPAALMTVVTLYGAILLMLSFRLGVFDRYLLVLVPPLAALLAFLRRQAPEDGRPSWRLRLALAVIAVCGVFSVAATHDYLAWNRSRLAATEALAQSHVPPTRIDGGYEYNGFYTYDPRYVSSPAKSYWWVVDDEYVVASGPLRGYRLVQRFPFRRWLLGSGSEVDILKRIAAGAN